MAVKQRHRMVYKKLSENDGKLGKALKAVGYSDAVVNKPTQVTNSKSWKELMNEVLSDEKLSNVHDKLLASEDENIQTRALDLGYKVKGRYAENPVTNNIQIGVVMLPSRGNTEIKQVENENKPL